MRDGHKMREQTLIRLTPLQFYGILGGAVLLVITSGLLGYQQGRTSAGDPEVLMVTPGPLIPAGVEDESVARLLARAAERQAAEDGKVDLDYHEMLPAASEGALSPGKDGAAELPQVAPTPTPVPVRLEARAEVAPANGGDEAPQEKGTTNPSGEMTQSPPGGAAPPATDPPGRTSADLTRPARASGETTGTRSYTVQVASYQTEEQASTLQAELQKSGFEVYLVKAEVNGRTWHRVRVGTYTARPDADTEVEKIKKVKPELSPMITYR